MSDVYLSKLHGIYARAVTKRLVDIDDDLLEEATALLGASTMKEAVNRSLEAVVLAERRRRHADRLEAMQRPRPREPEGDVRRVALSAALSRRQERARAISGCRRGRASATAA